jgi:hypothetical protein
VSFGGSRWYFSANQLKGMNTSIQDAFNLGWKLALVTKSLASPKILESFTAELLPIIAGVLKRTTESLNRNFATDNVSTTWTIGQEYRQLDVHYRGSPIVFDELKSEDNERVTAGDRAPDAPALVPLTAVKTGASQLFDLFSPTRHTAIIFPADKEEITKFTAALYKYPGGAIYPVVVLPKGSELAKESFFDWGADVVLDNDRHCWNTYPTKEGAKVVIVRPDGCVGAVAESTAGIEQYRGVVFDTRSYVAARSISKL